MHESPFPVQVPNLDLEQLVSHFEDRHVWERKEPLQHHRKLVVYEELFYPRRTVLTHNVESFQGPEQGRWESGGHRQTPAGIVLEEREDRVHVGPHCAFVSRVRSDDLQEHQTSIVGDYRLLDSRGLTLVEFKKQKENATDGGRDDFEISTNSRFLRHQHWLTV